MPYVASSTPYATTADLVTYGMSAAALSTPATSNAVQTQAILAASEQADSYLRQQFQLPLTQWGSDLVMHVCWIAHYILINQRGYNPEGGADESFETRYKLAKAWFADVAAGKVTPNVTSSASGAVQGTQDVAGAPEPYSPNELYPNSLGWSVRGTGNR